MDIWRNNSLSLPADRRSALILGGSVAFHVVALTLLGLNLADRYDPPGVLDASVYIDLEPWPDVVRIARPPPGPAPSPATAPARPASERLPSLPDLRQPPLVHDELPPSPAAPSAAPALVPRPPAPSLNRADAVGAGLVLPNAWGGDVCRNAADFAAWQAARCGERGRTVRAETRSSRDLEAAVGERRGDASERQREDGFARQKALNDRWAEYHRYRDAPYPGLRSMFTHD